MTSNISSYRRKAIPENASWARSGKTAPLSIVGESNVVGHWAFYDCDHAIERFVERGARYELDDLNVVAAIDLEAVFTSNVIATTEFKSELTPSRNLDTGKWELPRVQIRDVNNDTISMIVEIDVATREVFLVTVIAPKEEGGYVQKKRNFLLNIGPANEQGEAKLLFCDNRFTWRWIAEEMIEDTSWLA